LSHFSAKQRFELAGNMVSAEQRRLILRHLEGGCEECQKLSAMWTRVVEINRREQDYEPPGRAVRSAKALFVSERSWRLRQAAQVALLIFDTVREPAPEAIRGPTTSYRQVLQEAQPFLIDLRVECDPVQKCIRLTGQVLNSKEPDKNVTNVEVFLLKGEHLAARTKANASGEFDLEFKDEEGLQLFIDVRGQQVIEIRLPTSPTDGHRKAAGAE
jgi:hypothetical protein